MRGNASWPAPLSWLPPRWLVAVLVVWTAVCARLALLGGTAQRHGAGLDWRAFLVPGSRLLYSGAVGYACPGQAFGHLPGGLHLYASYPCLQIGPLAFAVAGPIRLLGPSGGVIAASVIMSAIGLVVLLVLWRIMTLARPELAPSRATRWTFLAGAAVFLVPWQTLAVADGHLDDVLALLCVTLAMLAAVRGRPVACGLALGLAVVAKPWGLLFLPVLGLAAGLAGWRSAAARPGGWPAARVVRASIRPCLLATAVAAAVIGAGWLPFYLADPSGTGAALHFQIYNSWASGLRVLGVHARYGPGWVRPAQFAAACVLGAAALCRRRWPAVLLLSGAARIALDPGAHGYYTPGLLVGALLWDLAGWRRPVPVTTVLAFAALNVIPLLEGHGLLRGEVRFGMVAGIAALVLACPRNWCGRLAPEVPAFTPLARPVAAHGAVGQPGAAAAEQSGHSPNSSTV